MTKLQYRKILVTLITVLLLIGVVNFSLFRYIPIQFVAAVAAVPGLPYLKNQNDDNSWFLVNDKVQYQNWSNKGLNLPKCDFSKNFLIVSRYRIAAAFYSPFINDECCGAPRGFAYYRKGKSEAGFAYIYLMPTIWLTQGIG
jgi:hypothetical protein